MGRRRGEMGRRRGRLGEMEHKPETNSKQGRDGGLGLGDEGERKKTEKEKGRKKRSQKERKIKKR